MTGQRLIPANDRIKKDKSDEAVRQIDYFTATSW